MRTPPFCQMHLEVLCHCQLAGLLKLGSAIAIALFAFLNCDTLWPSAMKYHVKYPVWEGMNINAIFV